MKAMDTNVLVRYYTADDAKQHAAAVAALKGEEALFVPKTVVQELWWALTSTRQYRFSENKVNAVITHLAGLSNIVLEDADVVVTALKYQHQGVEFADALHLASSAGCGQLLTFDAAFKKRATKLNLRPSCVVPV